MTKRGAPRPMKMGTIVSPWRDECDAAAEPGTPFALLYLKIEI
jgi:hypothetical protein